jgi:acetyltransferase-like isoleucine patch superfamily enzyme
MRRPPAPGPLRDLRRRLGYEIGPRLMSELRKRWVRFRHPHADIEFHPTTYLGPGFSLHIPGAGRFVAGPGVEFRRGFRAEVWDGGRIEIAADAVFTYYVVVQCSGRVTIGERCQFGQSTMVVDGQHRFRALDRPMLQQGYKLRDIVIEDDATITTKCTIMASIGKRAFIGANSVVTRPIPAYTIAIGAPARPVDYFGPPGSEPDELTADAADPA